ncbi:hypothetical protein JZX86_17160 [Agrobacterium rosae]|uniref:hypothetical protein n=1 Tax=Agrobacterium rosae TaxID=1972867 RepID=UPI0019D33FAC|nr:hypothetical protein [Agrobacterium rosae]MBN7807084.1 hypothetical protein [Agrobacterium rosae]
MVDLTPYIIGFQYNHGVKLLEKVYAAARSSLQSEIHRVESEAAAYHDALSNGGEWKGEVEDGHILWEQSQVYELEINDVHYALFEVRKAFTIALYHYWEDSIAGLMGLKGKGGDHETLSAYCGQKGWGPSPELDAVRHLTNHLKHGHAAKNDWMGELSSKYPSFLTDSVHRTFEPSEETLTKVASAVLTSGPAHKNY